MQSCQIKWRRRVQCCTIIIQKTISDLPGLYKNRHMYIYKNLSSEIISIFGPIAMTWRTSYHTDMLSNRLTSTYSVLVYAVNQFQNNTSCTHREK